MPAGWPSRFCCDEELALIGYDGRDAESDLARWRGSGPRATTQELVDVIVRQGVEGATVVDIGAGAGAVHLLLLEAGAARAVDVDASREYQDSARAEAARRGLLDRVEYRYGDAVELAADLPPADIVTMDSVVCCYPYLPALLDAAVSPAPRLLGLTYPRDVWWMVAFMQLFNVAHALRRSHVRYFVYRHRQLRRMLAERRYDQLYDGGSRGWRVVVFQRT